MNLKWRHPSPHEWSLEGVSLGSYVIRKSTICPSDGIVGCIVGCVVGCIVEFVSGAFNINSFSGMGAFFSNPVIAKAENPSVFASKKVCEPSFVFSVVSSVLHLLPSHLTSLTSLASILLFSSHKFSILN